MHGARLSQARTTALAIFAVVVTLGNGAWAAPKLKVLHTFRGGRDAAVSVSSVVFDALGNLYGTTPLGGNATECGGAGCGTAFELMPSGSNWKESVLYRFSPGADGYPSFVGLVVDGAGNLYGTTVYGGNVSECGIGCGVVFELTLNLDRSWTENVLHAFNGGPDDGGYPDGTLVFDSAGNLYGTTKMGGADGYGTVFELSPNSGGGWTESVLHSFTLQRDGGSPSCALVLDSSGNLYGTTQGGGVYGSGTVFELTPHSGGAWTEKVLYDFTGGDDGANPSTGVIFDAKGNLYGTTLAGGTDDVGVVFKLTPTKGVWNITLLHSFTGGGDGGQPSISGLVRDTAGNLYGTTLYGGLYEYGTVFKLVQSAPKGSRKGEWKETVLHSFTNGRDGAVPDGGVILDSAGNLYGTTLQGGGLSCHGQGCGTVFEITP